METTTHDRTDMRSPGTGVQGLRRRGPGGPLKGGASVLRSDLVGIVGTLVALFLMPAVYAAQKFPDYPVRPAGDYAVTAERAGLIIGVQPVEDLKEQKTYFHTELTPKGFIPVFIVMLNGSSGDSFLFDKTGIRYGPVDSDLLSNPKARPNRVESVLLAGGVLAGRAISKASEVQQNILKKELQSTTLSSGVSVHGFLYVPVPEQSRPQDKPHPRQKLHLRVPITRAGTGESLVLDLVF